MSAENTMVPHTSASVAGNMTIATQTIPTTASQPPAASQSAGTSTGTTAAGAGRGGMMRVQAKLEASVAAGNFYEAHQMYRTLYFRYQTQQRYDDCLQLLFTGAVHFLQQGQFSTGADLGCLVVDTLQKMGAARLDEHQIEMWIGRLCNMLEVIGPTAVERESFLLKSVSWSGDVSKNMFGHPLMHKMIAQILWAEANLMQARNHFLLSRDGEGCGQLLVQLSVAKGAASELDLFVAQMVMQQLCLRERATAAQTFETYAKFHPRIARTEPPFALPLLNFVFFLLKSCETGKLAVFEDLCEIYKVSLARDASFAKYVQKIAMVYFDAAPQARRGHGGGLFGDLISQMFSGFGEDGDDDEEGGGERGPPAMQDAELD